MLRLSHEHLHGDQEIRNLEILNLASGNWGYWGVYHWCLFFTKMHLLALLQALHISLLSLLGHSPGFTHISWG